MQTTKTGINLPIQESIQKDDRICLVKQSEIILGIDPGFAIVGWGLIEKRGTILKYLSCGAITTQPRLTFAERLHQIHAEMNNLITITKPTILALEQLFFSTNVKTAINVAHARGVILLTAVQHRIPVAEYGPLTIKQTITGDGKAEKKQMQKMVQKILKLDTIPKPDDVADAVAIALTHSYHT